MISPSSVSHPCILGFHPPMQQAVTEFIISPLVTNSSLGALQDQHNSISIVSIVHVPVCNLISLEFPAALCLRAWVHVVWTRWLINTNIIYSVHSINSPMILPYDYSGLISCTPRQNKQPQLRGQVSVQPCLRPHPTQELPVCRGNLLQGTGQGGVGQEPLPAVSSLRGSGSGDLPPRAAHRGYLTL